jgi:hypothetical protein
MARKVHDSYAAFQSRITPWSRISLQAVLERIPFQWNRNSLQFFLSSRIFCGEPVPTSPENALEARES